MNFKTKPVSIINPISNTGVEAVAESSKQFSKNAKTVKKNLWWKNMKFTLIVTFVIICLIVGIGVLIWMNNR